MQAAARMEHYDLNLDVRNIFQYQTVREIASVVEIARNTADNSIVEGEFGLMPIQRMLA